MCVISTAPILVNEEPLKFVEDFTYLGSLISKESGASKYIKAKLGKVCGERLNMLQGTECNGGCSLKPHVP